MIALPALYTLLSVLFAALLVLFLWRPAYARPVTVWALAAGVPVLAAVAASLVGQARADEALRGYVPVPVTVTVTGPGQPRTVTVSGMDAACLTRARMIRKDLTLVLPKPEAPLRLRLGAVIQGALPPESVVQALTVRGSLRCWNLRTPTTRELDDDSVLSP